MVSICPLLWQRDVKLQQTKPLEKAMEQEVWIMVNMLKFKHSVRNVAYLQHLK